MRRRVRPIDTVFYMWMRCEPVHAGGWPADPELMPAEDLSVRAGGHPECVLKASRGWFRCLMAWRRDTPE